MREVYKVQQPISKVAESNHITPQDIYHWEKQLFEAAPEVLTAKPGCTTDEALLRKRIEELEAKLKKKDAVIAEITEENLAIKKSPGEI